jgi:hypothetical protein
MKRAYLSLLIAHLLIACTATPTLSPTQSATATLVGSQA